MRTRCDIIRHSVSTTRSTAMEKGSDTRSGSESPSPPPPGQSNYLKELILSYETCPSLWDPRNENYLNKTKKNKDLDKLVEIYKHLKPNATREDVRRKVNSLRSNYRKELKKIEQSKRSGRGTDDVYKPTSSTFNLLKFLTKIEKPVLLKENSENLQQENNSLVFSSLTNEEPPTKLKKITRVSISKQNELISRACTLLSQPAELSQQNVNPLALVWSEKIKNLNPTQRLYAEKAINDILFEAELNNLSQNSVQINNFSPSSLPPAIQIPASSDSTECTATQSQETRTGASLATTVLQKKRQAPKVIIQRSHPVDSRDCTVPEIQTNASPATIVLEKRLAPKIKILRSQLVHFDSGNYTVPATQADSSLTTVLQKSQDTDDSEDYKLGSLFSQYQA